MRNQQTTIARLVAAMMLLLFATLPARASIIALNGLVDFADPGNPFGVVVDDAITGSVTFNESLLLLDPNAIISPSIDPTIMLSLTIGGVNFVETDDAGYDAFPELTFIGGVLANIDFVVDFDLIGDIVDPLGGTYAFGLFDGAFEIFDAINDPFPLIVSGTVGPLTTVPEPATFLLLLTGMAGLGASWMMRKKGQAVRQRATQPIPPSLPKGRDTEHPGI